MLLVYGATGYTGQLIAEAARRKSDGLIVAGRDANKLRALGAALDCEARVCSLNDPGRLDALLSDVDVVLNAAGPFAKTAMPIADACLRTGTHYLDVAGDIRVFEGLHGWSDEAADLGVMLMPGAGFSVAASDCLAAALLQRLPTAQSLAIGISRPTLWSRGSMTTLMELWSDRVDVRRNGELESVFLGDLEREFDYGWGPRPSTAMGWPDVYTSYLSTGIPNIEVYGEVDGADRVLIHWTKAFGQLADNSMWRNFTKLQWQFLPDGPSEQMRAQHRRVLVGEARDDAGRSVSARMRTSEPYTFTVHTACAVVERIQQGDFAPGFQTPASIYGPSLVVGGSDAEFEELQPAEP